MESGARTGLEKTQEVFGAAGQLTRFRTPISFPGRLHGRVNVVTRIAKRVGIQ